LYSSKYNTDWSINSLNSIAQHPIVPVGFKAGVNGDYTINASELKSFTIPTYIYLKDLFTNTLTDLNHTSSYSFTATINDNADRFQLIFASSPLGIINNNVIQQTSIYSNNHDIFINSNESIKQIIIYNTIGQLIKKIENVEKGNTVINMKDYAMSYYIVKVITNHNVYSEKVLIK
jgi:hypothetical protein